MELKINDYRNELSALRIRMEEIYDNPKYDRKDLDQLDEINIKIDETISELIDLAKKLKEI
jgi:hypothetical protein